MAVLRKICKWKYPFAGREADQNGRDASDAADHEHTDAREKIRKEAIMDRHSGGSSPRIVTRAISFRYNQLHARHMHVAPGTFFRFSTGGAPRQRTLINVVAQRHKKVRLAGE